MPLLNLRTCPNPLIFGNFDATVLCDDWVDSKKVWYLFISPCRAESKNVIDASMTRRWNVKHPSIKIAPRRPEKRCLDPAISQGSFSTTTGSILIFFGVFRIYISTRSQSCQQIVDGTSMNGQSTVKQIHLKMVSRSSDKRSFDHKSVIGSFPRGIIEQICCLTLCYLRRTCLLNVK